MKKMICIFILIMTISLLLISCGAPRNYTLAPPSDNIINEPSDEMENTILKAVENLPTGTILFNSPSEMAVGQNERVEVRITKGISDNLTKGLKGRGVPQIETITVGTYMDVKLEGEKFSIKSLSNDRQIVSGKGFAQWSWDVKPLSSGNQTLSLVVNVRVKMPDSNSEELVSIPVFDKKIHVKVNPIYTVKTSISKYWGLIFPLIFSSVIAPILVKRWTEKRKAKED